MLIRPASNADAAAISAFYAGLSDEAFATRFFSVNRRQALLDRLAEVPAADRGTVLVAFEPASSATLLGEARYQLVDASQAEFGVAVADEARRRGLGRELLRRLLAAARRQELEGLVGVIRTDNTAMLRLAQSFGCALVEPTTDNAVTVEMATAGGMPGWGRRSTGRRVLVESRSIYDSPTVEAMRAQGDDVRICLGPNPALGRLCPLVEQGACALAENADVILHRLCDDYGEQVAARHRANWPSRLVNDYDQRLQSPADDA
jgi:L-amino acid N-acyltransferase YncA